MRYPHYRDELVTMLEVDQREVRAHSRLYKRSPESPELTASRKWLTGRNLKRAERMLEILDDIGALTLENIGADGSEAVMAIALHSKYSIMKKVLSAYEAALSVDRTNVYLRGIPSLTDRILIFERKKQRFGSQWLIGADGTFFFYPVEDFKHMNERRAAYGLEPARYPRDLTYGIPIGLLPPETQETDQREPTQEEHDYNVSEMID